MYEILVTALSVIVLLFALYGVPARPSEGTGAANHVAATGIGEEVFTLGAYDGQTPLFALDAVTLLGKRIAPNAPRPSASPDSFRVPQGEVLGFVGWAIDPKTKLPAKEVVALVDSTLVFVGRVGSPRQDVATYFKLPDAVKSGFSATVPTVDLSQGKHRLRFRIISSDGASYYSVSESFVVEITASTIAKSRARAVLDSVDGLAVPSDNILSVHGKQQIDLVGWAAADLARSIAFDSAVVLLDGKPVATETAPKSRPDVAQAFGLPDMRLSGFDVRVPLGNILPGRHSIKLRLLSTFAAPVDSGVRFYLIR